jgi:hypothetical protein
MTTPNEEDVPEHPLVELIQAKAQALVQRLCDALGLDGWDFVVVSVTRRVDLPGNHTIVPGATALHVNRPRMKESLDVNAAALRKIADQLDAMTDTRSVADMSSYVQDKSRPGHAEWPK